MPVADGSEPDERAEDQSHNSAVEETCAEKMDEEKDAVGALGGSF